MLSVTNPAAIVLEVAKIWALADKISFCSVFEKDPLNGLSSSKLRLSGSAKAIFISSSVRSVLSIKVVIGETTAEPFGAVSVTPDSTSLDIRSIVVSSVNTITFLSDVSILKVILPCSSVRPRNSPSSSSPFSLASMKTRAFSKGPS